MSYQETHPKYKKVLLIDRGYTPLNVITWKKAMCLVYGREKAEIIKSYSTQLDLSGLDLRPSVVRLVVPCPHPHAIRKKFKFNRRYVFIRDNYLCQYCNKNLKHKKDDLTVDHVHPRAKGGKSNYLNCVAACRPCNQTKGDLTPQEAGMKLMQAPRNPTFSWLLQAKEHLDEWGDYLPGVNF